MRLAALVLASAAVARANDAFVDPLDQPAARTSLAPQRQLTAAAVAGTRIVAAGQRGHIVFSDDRGQTWTQAEVPVSTDLTALSFPTPQRGWAVGHDGVVLGTVDGGATWTRQLDGRKTSALISSAARSAGLSDQVREQLTFLGKQGPDLPLLDVYFEDEQHGFVVGAFNLILRTQDGGVSWTPWLDRTDNPKALHLYSIQRAGGALFIAGEQGLVLRLEKGRFVACPTPYAGSFFGVTGSDGAVLVFGLRGNVFRSRDRGATWEKVETGIEIALTSGARASGGRILLASAAGHLLVSSDGGATFSPARVRPAPTSGLVADGNAAVLVGMLGARVEELK